MSYAVAAYTIAVGAVMLYGARLFRERRRLRRALSAAGARNRG